MNKNATFLAKLNENFTVEEHDTRESVVAETYQDQIAEGATLAECISEFHFCPCVTIH